MAFSYCIKLKEFQKTRYFILKTAKNTVIRMSKDSRLKGTNIFGPFTAILIKTEVSCVFQKTYRYDPALRSQTLIVLSHDPVHNLRSSAEKSLDEIMLI